MSPIFTIRTYSLLVAFVMAVGCTPQILKFAQSGQLDKVKQEIEGGADVDASNGDGESALKKACLMGHVDVVQYLVANGANVNNLDRLHTTPLMAAAFSDEVEVAKILVGNDADTDQVSRLGTALYIASERGGSKTVELLIENGANLNIGKFRGSAFDKHTTPLMVASKEGHEDIVMMLLEADAIVDKFDYNGMSALIYAAANNNTEVVKLLLESGAVDTEAPEGSLVSGVTALGVAKSAGHGETVELLTDVKENKKTAAPPE